MTVRYGVLVATLLLLTGCRADVTQTIDTTAAGKQTITYAETFDDEAMVVAGRVGGPSAFAFDAAHNDGWDVHGSSEGHSHTFTFKKTFTNEEVVAGITRLENESFASTPNDALLISPVALIGLPISAAAAGPKASSIPALLRPSETLKEKGRKDPSFQLANAIVNAAEVGSVVHVHIVVRDATGEHRVDPSFAYDTSISEPTAVQIGAPWPITLPLLFWRTVGPYGVLDLEHQDAPLCSTQTKNHEAWMFGVGVYAEGARIPKDLLINAASSADSWITDHPVACPAISRP